MKTQFLQHCKATKRIAPKPDMNASDKEFMRQFAESVEAMALNVEYSIPMFRCDYRTKIFVTFFSKNNEELGTEGKHPWARKDQMEVFPGQTVDFYLTQIPENAEAWYVWVPR